MTTKIISAEENNMIKFRFPKRDCDLGNKFRTCSALCLLTNLERILLIFLCNMHKLFVFCGLLRLIGNFAGV